MGWKELQQEWVAAPTQNLGRINKYDEVMLKTLHEKEAIKNDFNQLEKKYKVIRKSNAKYVKKEQKKKEKKEKEEKTLDETGPARKKKKNKKKKKGGAQHEEEKQNKENQEKRKVKEAEDKGDTPTNSDGEWMEQGLQGEARGVGEASEAMVPGVKRKKVRMRMKKRKGILRSKQLTLS